MTSRAWVDEADRRADHRLPDFVKRSHQLPSWAASTGSESNTGSVSGVKRWRDEGLDALLARTEPLLTSRNDRQHAAVPPVLSVLPLPRDAARSVQWHRNGQLAIVGGNRHVYLFHAAGRFVEQLAKTDVGKRVEHTVLGATGEDVVVVGHQSYAPDLLTLATGTITPLKFLSTRDSAIYRNGRRDNGKHDFYITKAFVATSDTASRTVGVVSGGTVTISSLASGSITHRIEMSDPVLDVTFSNGSHELTVATRNKLTVYDVRKTARFLRETSDNGTVDITTFANTDTAFAVGSASGVVSVYGRDGVTAGPLRTLKNLTTSISCLAFGERSNGDIVLAYATKGQKGGFRLAVLPECRVVPSFPAVEQRHHFIQSLTVAPTVSVLSVGEKQKVTNYAL